MGWLYTVGLFLADYLTVEPWVRHFGVWTLATFNWICHLPYDLEGGLFIANMNAIDPPACTIGVFGCICRGGVVGWKALISPIPGLGEACIHGVFMTVLLVAGSYSSPPLSLAGEWLYTIGPVLEDYSPYAVAASWSTCGLFCHWSQCSVLADTVVVFAIGNQRGVSHLPRRRSLLGFNALQLGLHTSVA